MNRRSTAFEDTFVDFSERVIDEVAVMGAEYIERMVSMLMPDGRRFGEEKLEMNERLNIYSEIRGDPQKWRQWIERMVMEVRQLLADSGVPEEEIISVHPYDIVEAMAVAYSSKMEALLESGEEDEDSERLVPSLPEDDEE